MNETIRVGDTAPDFELEDQYGEKIKLSDFEGKRVLLSWHPLAFTSVCLDQVRSLERNYGKFEDAGVEVLSLSVDAAPSKAAWAKMAAIEKVRILSDFNPLGATTTAYGLFLMPVCPVALTFSWMPTVTWSGSRSTICPSFLTSTKYSRSSERKLSAARSYERSEAGVDSVHSGFRYLRGVRDRVLDGPIPYADDLYCVSSRHHSTFDDPTEHTFTREDAITGLVVDGAAGVAGLPDLRDLHQRIAYAHTRTEREFFHVDPLDRDVLAEVPHRDIEAHLTPGRYGLLGQERHLTMPITYVGVTLDASVCDELDPPAWCRRLPRPLALRDVDRRDDAGG